MENGSRSISANEFESIDAYNRQAGELAEPLPLSGGGRLPGRLQ
jgi:hypothetical protein